MFPHFFKDACCLFLFFTIVFLTISCGKKSDEAEVYPLEYEVCDETELPDELRIMIEERKEEEFQIIYENSACRYVAAGYGKQKRDEYVVAVKDFYGSGKEIVLDTILIHKSKGEKGRVGRPGLCPYIVIRTSHMEGQIAFE